MARYGHGVVTLIGIQCVEKNTHHNRIWLNLVLARHVFFYTSLTVIGIQGDSFVVKHSLFQKIFT